MGYRITNTGSIIEGASPGQFMYALAQDLGKLKVRGTTALVDNSGGSTSNLLAPATTVGLSDAPNGGAGAEKASTETNLGLIKDALQELATKTIATFATLGIPAFTYAGGGTTADGTIGAISGTVNGTATGATLANVTPIVTTYNNAFLFLATKINEACSATGQSRLILTNFGNTAPTAPASLSTSVGTASATSLTNTQVQVILNVYKNNVARMASRLNSLYTLTLNGTLAK